MKPVRVLGSCAPCWPAPVPACAAVGRSRQHRRARCRSVGRRRPRRRSDGAARRHECHRKTATDADGRFRFPYLKIGPCIVTVRHPGFRDAAQSLTLSAGAAFELPISLAVGGVDTDVTSPPRAPCSRRRAARLRGRSRNTRWPGLPLNGRNFLDVALLVPGVSPTNVPATQMFPETSPVPGVGLSVSSQRNLSNNFVVDGLSANDDAAALVASPTAWTPSSSSRS